MRDEELDIYQFVCFLWKKKDDREYKACWGNSGSHIEG